MDDGGKWLVVASSAVAAVGCMVFSGLRQELRRRAPVVQSLAGQTHVVTGANGGIGFAASRALSARGARVVMVCRDSEKCEAAAARLRGSLSRQRGEVAGSVSPATCDLSSQSSILAFATETLPALVPDGARTG